MAYVHGAFARIVTGVEKEASGVGGAPIYVGTAPVHTVDGGNSNLNKPKLVKSFGEAVSLFGYSDEWAKYTLCEAMWAHFVKCGVGPIILINCLDVADCKDAEASTASATPAGGKITITDAGEIILDSIAITGKTLGTDYTVEYDYETQKITIAEITGGGLGTAAVTVTYNTIDPSKVTAADVIGSTDGAGTNAGVYAVKDVYQATGKIPALLLCPGFSDTKAVRDAMKSVSEKVNGHWDMIFYSDLPLLNASGEAITVLTAAAYKSENGYTAENEKVFYPKAIDADGKIFHLSVLACVNRQALDEKQDGIPYQTPSNTDIDIERLYFGESAAYYPDDTTISEKLNKSGITSAAFVGGRWAIWGAHAAAYAGSDAADMSGLDANGAMLRYITNDFQMRRAADIDKLTSLNRLKQIAAEEQARLDALVGAGALIYGKARLVTGTDALSDMVSGKFTFEFDVTVAPVARGITALVRWTDEGLTAYYTEGE